MSKKRKVAKEIKTPFKELSFSQKVEHIFTYYKYYFIAAILIIATVFGVVNAYKRNNYKTECKIIVVDGRITGHDDNTDAITTGLTEHLGIDGKSHRVICDYNLSLNTQAGDDDVYYSQSKIYAMASTGDMDGYLANIDYIDYFSTNREVFLYDLRELLTEDELNRIADHILYFTKDDGTKIPYAVDLTSTKIKTQTDLSIENPCYGVVVTAAHPENATAFIRYAFDL